MRDKYLKRTHFLAAALALSSMALAICPDVYATSPSRTSKNSTTKQKMNQPKLHALTPGNWGATGVNAVIEKKAVAIQFDCAEGEIRQALMIDKKGVFKVDGF